MQKHVRRVRLENLAPRQLSELLLLPRFDPKITAKLLRRVSRQAMLRRLDGCSGQAATLAISCLDLQHYLHDPTNLGAT